MADHEYDWSQFKFAPPEERTYSINGKPVSEAEFNDKLRSILNGKPAQNHQNPSSAGASSRFRLAQEPSPLGDDARAPGGEFSNDFLVRGAWLLPENVGNLWDDDLRQDGFNQSVQFTPPKASSIVAARTANCPPGLSAAVSVLACVQA